MANNDKFAASVNAAASEIIRKVTENMEKACLYIETEAKKGCPVDTGHLRASIMSEVEAGDLKITGRIGSNLEYAPYVHQGTGIYAEDGNGRKTPWAYRAEAGKYKGFHRTRGQKPQPFLKNAVVKNRKKIERKLGGDGN